VPTGVGRGAHASHRGRGMVDRREQWPCCAAAWPPRAPMVMTRGLVRSVEIAATWRHQQALRASTTPAFVGSQGVAAVAGFQPHLQARHRAEKRSSTQAQQAPPRCQCCPPGCLHPQSGSGGCSRAQPRGSPPRARMPDGTPLFCESTLSISRSTLGDAAVACAPPARAPVTPWPPIAASRMYSSMLRATVLTSSATRAPRAAMPTARGAARRPQASRRFIQLHCAVQWGRECGVMPVEQDAPAASVERGCA